MVTWLAASELTAVHCHEESLPKQLAN
eukprot:COSAG02_NODE_60491_length_271_cov_0.604651_1_plen_26_part_10